MKKYESKIVKSKMKPIRSKVNMKPVRGKIKSLNVAVEEPKPVVEECKTKKMGFNFDPNSLTFSRRFRWTMESQSLPCDFFKTVEFDYAKRQVKFKYYDVIHENKGFHAFIWADLLGKHRLPGEALTFIAYDGCGNVLYKQVFEGLELLEHTSNMFDYESSDAADQTIKVSYRNVNIETLIGTNKVTNNNTKIHFEDKNGVKITGQAPAYMNKLKGDVEEVKFCHLNATTFVPGKLNWEKAIISTESVEIRRHVASMMAGGLKCSVAVITEFEQDVAIEQWKLINAWPTSVDFNEKNSEFGLRFSELTYENLIPRGLNA